MVRQFHDRILDDDALDQIFREGRSYNGWLDRPVADDQLRAIWDLAKMGPTSANMQPARIVWVKSSDSKERLAELVMEGNKAKVLAAPVTAIIGYDIDFHEHLPWLFPHTDAKSWFPDEGPRQEGAFRNSSLQGAYFIIAARAVGLDMGPMSGFDNARVDAAFFSDQPRVRSNFICSVGYGDPATVFERSPRPEFERFNRIV